MQSSMSMISLQNKNGLYFLFYEVGGHKETIKFENLKHYQQTIHSPSIHNTKQHLLIFPRWHKLKRTGRGRLVCGTQKTGNEVNQGLNHNAFRAGPRFHDRYADHNALRLNESRFFRPICIAQYCQVTD